MRRHSAVAAFAALAALTFAPLTATETAARASTLAATFTKRTLHVDTVVGPSGGTHCDVVADLYEPAAATSPHSAPAILTTNGFGGSKDDQADLAAVLARRGYVVLSYSGLGFGGSGCKITLDDPDFDGKAASQLVSLLAGTKAAKDGTRVASVRLDAPGDPRVGMVGGSYGGEIQFAAASVDPRIDAIVPMITWNDLAYSLAPNNTSFGEGVTYTTPGTEKFDWTTLFFALGIVDGLEFARVDPHRLTGCPNFTDGACQAKLQMDLEGYPDAETLQLARHASVASYVSRVRVPTLLIQGEADTLFNLQEAVATYRALRAQGTPVKMIWQSWGHSDSTPAPGELDLGDHPERTYEGQRILAWFDHYLKDAATGTGPNFAYFRDWVRYDGIATPAYGTAPAYPVGHAERLYLSGDDDLVTSPADVRAGTDSYANLPLGVPSSYSETSALQGSVIPDPLTPPSDAPGTYAGWTTRPLAHDVDAVGVPTLDVRLRSFAAELGQRHGPGGKLVLFAKLYDVAPDGKVTLVHRLVSPVRVPDVDDPLHVELPGIVHRFEAGHRVRLVIAASDAAYKNNIAVYPVHVTTSPDHPGVLTLPVVAAGVATR